MNSACLWPWDSGACPCARKIKSVWTLLGPHPDLFWGRKGMHSVLGRAPLTSISGSSALSAAPLFHADGHSVTTSGCLTPC